MTASARAGQGRSVQEFLSGKLAQVDVPAIERELRRLWQEASGHPGGEQSDVARACTLNLILFTDEETAELTTSALLDAIMLRRPCRALLAVARAGQVPGVEAWVSARCHLAGTGSSRQICCEQITVKSQGQAVQALPSVVVPLLVPDLPVFLWSRTAGFDRESLAPFLPALDRLIVDSGPWELDRDHFGAVLAAAGSVAPRLVVSDLNWQRLLRWRKITAKAFDSLDIGLTPADLQEIDNVRLEFVAQGTGQAILMTSWLAAQLNWSPLAVNAHGDVTVLGFQQGPRLPRVEWVETSSPYAPEGSLTALEITLSRHRKLNLALRRLDKTPHIVARTSSPRGSSREVTGKGPELDEAVLVGCELDRLTRDPVLERALSMATRLCQLFQGGQR